MGGLGNQMFQISKATAEGLKNNIPVFFRSNAFIPMEGNQPENYKNNIFRNIKFNDIILPTKRITEPSWSYNKIEFTYDQPTEFYGYFQSSKNFLEFKKEIQKMFLPTEEFINKIKKIYPKIFDKNSTSIHVRRGDYLIISEILPVLDKTYFDHSVNTIDYSHLFIFSNDKEWSKTNLKYKNCTIVEGLKDYEELWLMSLCNHNIMSNSSFSWWGSYLNINQDKKVFCPSVWFGPKGEKNYQDVYEDDWIKINVKYKDNCLVYEKN